MKKILSGIRNNYALIFKGILFLLSIILIVWFYPKEGKFKYEFQKGKPWKYKALFAPEDFAIYKTAEELEEEKEDARLQVLPYFNYNTDNIQKLRDEFVNDLNAGMEESFNFSFRKKQKERFKQTALALYDSLQQKGILEFHEILENRSPEAEIILIREQHAKNFQVKDFYRISDIDKVVAHYTDKLEDMERDFIKKLIRQHVYQNVLFDAGKTNQKIEEAWSVISPTRGMKQRGQLIIGRGDIVQVQHYKALMSLKKKVEGELGSSSAYYLILLGQVLLVSIAILVLILFLIFFRKDVFDNSKNVVLILLLVVMMVGITSWVVLHYPDYLYLVPVCLVPIIMRVFFDTKLAIFVHVITTILISFLVPNSFEFVYLQLITGIVSIVSVLNLHKRSQFFMASLFIFLTYSAIYTGIYLIQSGTIEDIILQHYAMFAGSALLTLIAYPLIYLFEKLFGLITDVSLLELNDTNNKLLRELATRAPGTFQHSIQVANLAEEALHEIGGNVLLARTGAMYHDIGKTENPTFFIENQSNGINPHDDLGYEESARIIISHVRKGITKAKKNKVPEQVIDFIRTHHGTKKADYFYMMHKKEVGEDVEIDMEAFTYHGPIPYSKETAVVMMADAVEAASRSLKLPNEESISNLVEGIINRQMAENQFANSPLTLKEITKVKKVLINKLLNIHHIRIEYPE